MEKKALEAEDGAVVSNSLKDLFFKINLFKLEANYNIVVVFAIHCHGSAMGVHVSPILNLPPHPIPQGPNAPALSALSHASNLDW